jgi:hypothetical protein
MTWHPHCTHAHCQSSAVVPLKKLIENDIDQPFIDRDEFYQRYTFEYKARVIDVGPSYHYLSTDSPLTL